MFFKKPKLQKSFPLPFRKNEGLDYAPFDAKDRIGKMYQFFGDEVENIINELT